MIEPAMIALIRDGQTTLYRDPGGSIFFCRNLVWGHQGLEDWLRSRQPVDEFDCECGAGVIVDFDAQAMLWYTECVFHELPRSAQLIDTLIQASWPGFEIIYGDGISDLQVAAGGSLPSADDRSLRLREIDGDHLAGRSDALEDEAEDTDGFDPDDANERYAWITILDDDQTVHHRLIGEISLDVVRNQNASLARLLALPGYQVPAERNVTEAVLFDKPGRAIRLWGGRNIRDLAKEMSTHWSDWDVDVIERDGYRQHCQFSGPAGEPVSDAEALGEVIPELLRTNRLDATEVLGELGRSVKGCLAKAVALLTALVCFPFFVFALISGNWRTGGIAIGVIVLLVAVSFKWIERRWRQSFRASLAARTGGQLAEADAAPPVAGPTDPNQRRRELDALLRRAGLPCLQECEPFVNPSLTGAV